MQKGIDIYIRKILYPIRYIFLGYGSYLSLTLLYYQPILGLDCANPLQPFFGFAFRAFYGTAPCRQRFENLRVWAELFMSPSAQPMRLPSGVMKGAIFYRKSRFRRVMYASARISYPISSRIQPV